MWLLESIVLIFLFFTVSGSRRSYYILPIIPFCALLTAIYCNSQKKDRFKQYVAAFQLTLFIFISFIEITHPLNIPVITNHTGFVPPENFSMYTMVTGVLALAVMSGIKPFQQSMLGCLIGTDRNQARSIAGAVILMGGFFCFQQNSLDAYGRCFLTKQIFRHGFPLLAGFSSWHNG